MRITVWCAVAVLVYTAGAAPAEFGSRGGPDPANIDAIANVLRQDPYDMELLISFGTSKGGSAGHLALAIRDQAPGDDVVYSANFYADRAPKHEQGFFTDDLMVRIPKQEYLFRTTSSLDDKAAFGLDFGEIYKRSVVRVVLYEKYQGSTYVDPHGVEKVAFKDLPNCFPSVLSRDLLGHKKGDRAP